MSAPNIVAVHNAASVAERVKALGARLQQDLGSSDPLLVALVGGSVIFVADLARAVRQPIRFDFIQVQYSAGSNEEDILEIHFPISLDVAGQTLVIAKDVSSSGVIENYLSSQFLEHGAREVRFVTLIDVPSERKTDFNPDYSVFVAGKKATFVGYGLKYRGRYGNLPYIGRVADE